MSTVLPDRRRSPTVGAPGESVGAHPNGAIPFSLKESGESVRIPYGTRYLLITCSDPADRQFRGIAEACSLLAKTDSMHHLPWDGEALVLSRRRTLRWVVVSGHGAERTAWISDGDRRRLHPQDLELPPGVDLYLLACYQGRPETREGWAEETGAEVVIPGRRSDRVS